MLDDTPYGIEAARRAGDGTVILRCGGWWNDDAFAGALASYNDPADLLEPSTIQCWDPAMCACHHDFSRNGGSRAYPAQPRGGPSLRGRGGTRGLVRPAGYRAGQPLLRQPAYFVGIVVFASLWIALNTWGPVGGLRHVEPPPFFWLQGMVSVNALLLTMAALIRQNRRSELAEHRAHLDLQINLLTEEKVTCILEILGERRAPTQGKDDLRSRLTLLHCSMQ